LYLGFVSHKHFRLIDSLMLDLIPRLKTFVHDVTWSSALYNPKCMSLFLTLLAEFSGNAVQVPNLNAVVIHSTEEGVELTCSNRTQATLDINIKDFSLQLTMEKDGCYM